jgi:hypothetical protein
MRRFPVIIALVIAASASAAEIKPPDPSKPLFRILRFQKIAPGGQRPVGTVDDQPLLVVWSVSDLVLARDQKGVLITLTPKDAKAFAEITRKYNGRLLALDAGEGHALEVMHITAPITDGIIGFKHPDEAATAEYLRRRFRIAEFK